MSARRSKWIGRLQMYVTKAYPRRYPKMVVMDGMVLVAFESDEGLDGSVPFATCLDLSSPDYPLQIEKARNRAATARLAERERRALAVRELPNRAFCTQCGVGVGFDADGCCTSCGDGTCSMSDLARHLAAVGLRVEIDPALPEGSA